MMTMNIITQTTSDVVVSLISNVGFPIVICLILIYLMIEQNKSHKAEIVGMRTAIENNTLVLTRLCEKLESEK